MLRFFSVLLKNMEDLSRFFMLFFKILNILIHSIYKTFMFYQWFSRFFKIFQDFSRLFMFIKDLEWFLIVCIFFISIHVLSLIWIIFSRFFRIFQDFLCFIPYCISIKKYSSFINDLDKIFKIFHEFSRFFLIFFSTFYFCLHFTMIKSCISP